MGPADPRQRQALEQAKAQLPGIEARVATTTECIKVLVEAGRESKVNADLRDVVEDPLTVALCKVQLAQLRMAEAEGLAAIHNLTEYIRRAENPLYGATLIPPTGKTPGGH
jgi:hypothetical protein